MGDDDDDDEEGNDEGSTVTHIYFCTSIESEGLTRDRFKENIIMLGSEAADTMICFYGLSYWSQRQKKNTKSHNSHNAAE